MMSDDKRPKCRVIDPLKEKVFPHWKESIQIIPVHFIDYGEGAEILKEIELVNAPQRLSMLKQWRLGNSGRGASDLRKALGDCPIKR